MVMKKGDSIVNKNFRLSLRGCVCDSVFAFAVNSLDWAQVQRAELVTRRSHGHNFLSTLVTSMHTTKHPTSFA